MQMRLVILSVFSIALFAAGCTTTYVKEDFPSDADFYKHLNKNSGSADIIKMNDSLITANKILIANDSLGSKTAYDIAVNGSLVTSNFSLPLKDIKAVSMIHHGGINILYGTLAGMAAGGVLGGLLTPFRTSGNTGEHIEYTPNIVFAAILGLLPGAILGTILGHEDLYLFDDSFEGSQKKYNSSHKFGLKIGRHSGFNYKERTVGNYDLTGPVKITGYEIPGFMATLLYNQPLSRRLLISYELSFISERTDAWYWASIPEDINNNDSKYIDLSNRSTETLNVLELAPVGRWNLFRTPVSLYLIAGPKLDVIIPGKSEAVTFFNNKMNQFNTQGTGVSADYNNFVLGAAVGGGFTTGNLLPVELLIEARFNFDITPRFEIHYDVPGYAASLRNTYIHSALIKVPRIVPRKYGSNEFQLNIGAAIF